MRPWRPSPKSCKPAVEVLTSVFGRPGIEEVACLATISQGPKCSVRVTLARFGDRVLLGLRRWVKNPDEPEPVPTAKGVFIRTADIPELRRALDEAERLLASGGKDAAP